jgi:hypothetical protein
MQGLPFMIFGSTIIRSRDCDIFIIVTSLFIEGKIFLIIYILLDQLSNHYQISGIFFAQDKLNSRASLGLVF